MRRKIFYILLCGFLCVCQSIALAASIEITTGSGKHNGITDSAGRWLKNGCLVQVIQAGGGVIHPPSPNGEPAGGDLLLGTTEVGYNFPFDPNEGKFDTQVWVAGAGVGIFVRAWNAADPVKAMEWGDSRIFFVKGVDGELVRMGSEGDSPAIVLKKRQKG